MHSRRGAQGSLTRPQLNARSATGVDIIGRGQGEEGGKNGHCTDWSALVFWNKHPLASFPQSEGGQRGRGKERVKGGCVSICHSYAQ